MTELTPTFRRTTYETISPTQPLNDQSSRTILVSGASEGIGFGIARSYAQANAKRVIISSRSQQKLDDAVTKIREKGFEGEVSAIVLDVSKTAEIVEFWKRLAQEGTFIDVLVLSAARTGPTATATEVIEFFNINVAAKLHMLEQFRDQEIAGKEKQHRVLIDVTSAASHIYPYPRPAYAASKAAFSDYIGHLADSVPEEEVRLITFHPGAVFTPAAVKASEYSGDLPLWDHPSLSADMALWLSTPAASFLHGRFVWANWDANELVGLKEKILSDPGLLKIGVTGVESCSVQKLAAKCVEVPAPKDRSWT